MFYNLKVEASDAVQNWALFLDRIAIEGFVDGEKEIALMPGEHFFYYAVMGAGGKLTISLSGDPKAVIIVPENSKWPFAVEVPDDRTQARDRIYFVIGE